MTGQAKIGLGVIGLGRALVLSLPALASNPRFRLVAATDPRMEAVSRFADEFGARAHANLAALIGDPGVDAVYIASPHKFHADQAIAALDAGKHVLVEKPMAIELADCDTMAEAARRAGRVLMVGPSHGFDGPVLRAADLIASDRFGAPRMITALNYTDFLYRPRRPEELDTSAGGGVVFSQAAHQIDIVRRLACGREALSVRAATGEWDAARPSEGAYNALITFERGLSASLVYSGYARFDSDELEGWVSEFGQAKDPASHERTRRKLAAIAPDDEALAKRERTYGGGAVNAAGVPPFNEHFGFVLVSCERADIRLTPAGLSIYEDGQHRFEPLAPPAAAQANAFAAFANAIGGAMPEQDGAWGAETVRWCHALLRSSRENREIGRMER